MDKKIRQRVRANIPSRKKKFASMMHLYSVLYSDVTGFFNTYNSPILKVF
jgi:hypothetical protein